MKRFWMSLLAMFILALVLGSCAGSKKAVTPPEVVTEETPPLRRSCRKNAARRWCRKKPPGRR